MDTAANPYNASQFSIAASAAADERSTFIAKTYVHLAGAIGALVILEMILLQLRITNQLVGMMSGPGWLIVLGAFMGASWIANSWAMSSTSIRSSTWARSFHCCPGGHSAADAFARSLDGRSAPK